MKKVFTICMLALILTTRSSAQLNENFDNGFAPLQANCWEFPDMQFASMPDALTINGNGSPYSDPPVNSTSVRTMRTPYLYVGNTIDVSFLYRLSGNLGGAATRFIRIELIDPNGTVVQTLANLNVTNSATTTTLFSQTFSVNVPWAVYRLSITMGGNTGNGNVRLSIDDLYTDAYLLGCTAMAPLPVHLISFQGNMNKNNKVTLNWTVAANETVHSFEVERSTNGRDFTTVAVVFASEKMGDENYMFYETVSSGDKIMYRLKMIDNQRDIDYSKILIFNLKTTVSSNINIIGNPVNDKLTLSYTSASTKPVSIKIYDMSGKLVMNNKANMFEGNNTISLPLASTFKAGMYAVEINNGTELQTAKFIKQ